MAPNSVASMAERHYIAEVFPEQNLYQTWENAELVPGAVGCLFAPVQGSGGTDRRGDAVVVKSIYITGMVYRKTVTSGENKTDPEPASRVVLALYRDTQTNKTTASTERLYLSGTGQDWNCVRNMEYSRRFQVLKKWSFVFERPGWGAFENPAIAQQEAGGMAQTFDAHLELNDLVRFSGNTGTVVDSLDINYFVAGVSSAGSTFAPVTGLDYIQYVTRVGFDT